MKMREVSSPSLLFLLLLFILGSLPSCLMGENFQKSLKFCSPESRENPKNCGIFLINIRDPLTNLSNILPINNTNTQPKERPRHPFLFIIQNQQMGNCALKSITDSAQDQNTSHPTTSSSISQYEERQGEAIRRVQSAILPAKGGRRTSVVSSASGDGVWKVKLVIDPKELGQILAEDVNTEALIEQMRVAANSTPKRGKGGNRSGLNGSQFFTNTCTSLSDF